MKRKPHLLLDIDGVVLPHGSVSWPGGLEVPRLWDEPYDGVQWHDSFFDNVARAHVPHRITDAVCELSLHFQITWASLRGEQSRQIGEVLHVGNTFPYIAFQFEAGDRYVPTARKEPIIVEWAKHGEPFAWIDDAAIPPHWLSGQHGPSQPTHFEVPDPEIGIEQDHVDRLIDFAMGF